MTFSPSGSTLHSALRRRAGGGKGWLVALGLAALLLATSGGEPSGRILYTSNDTRTGGYDILLVNADGSGVTNLTEEPALDSEPDWSFDASQIVFLSTRDGDFDVYRMDADGSNVVMLTDTDEDEGGPVFSPACRSLPAPCTEWIAFDSDRTGDWEVYMMESDGSNVTQLTFSEGEDWWPTWSPDGTRIAYMSARDFVQFDIFVLDLRTGENWNYTDTPYVNEMWPVWSPDGRLIAYTSDEEYWYHIFVMDAGCSPECGANKRRVTPEFEAHDFTPGWSPDSQWIAFSSYRDPTADNGIQWDYELFLIRLDGSDMRQLTFNEYADDLTPDWAP